MFIIKEELKKISVIRKKQSLFATHNDGCIGAQKGFTLIEIVVTLLLVGILATLGGMFIVRGVKGYVEVQQNSVATQKAQMAMSRINREILEMINVSSVANSTILPITGTNNCNGTNCVRTIGLEGNNLKIAFGSNSPVGGDILLDNVSSFNFAYYNGTNVTTTWPIGQDLNLSAVGVNVNIARSDGKTLPLFTALIVPRNNGNLGGANIPNNLSAPAGWCFVATAAYGDPSHPMVRILREFRDRYLLTFGAGKWFVKQYYKYGPMAADMIRYRPLAMWAVRCMLAPLVALAFCLMYAPLAIIFIFLVALIITRVSFYILRKGFPNRFDFFQSRGSILISLIFTMVIMAFLAAAMLRMFSSSYMNQVYADQSRKAYYLAESGFRYAAFNYRNAATNDAKNTVLTNVVNNKTYNFLDGSSFTTVVFPFWFSTSAAIAAGASSIATTLYGTVPAEFGTSSDGYLKVDTGYYYYTGFSVSGTTVTFSGLAASAPTTSVPAISSGVDVMPVVKSGSAQNLSKGGTLSLSSTGIGVFPIYDGNFTLVNSSGGQVSSAIFNYTYRTGTTLYNVVMTDPGKNILWTNPISVPASSNVILGKFVRLVSTGTISTTSRTVTYNAPIGLTAGGGFQKQQAVDDMSSSANWYTSNAMGTQTFNSTVDGSAAMKVSTMQDTSASGFLGFLAWILGWGTGSGHWNLVEFNWNNTSARLNQAWMDAQGCLTYDIQAKVKNTQPWFFAGLNFRANTNASGNDFYTYGVSFVKPRAKITCICVLLCGWDLAGWSLTDDQPASLIPGGVNSSGSGTLFSGSLENGGDTSCFLGLGGHDKYEYGQPAVVLWQRTSSGFKWLAYNILQNGDGVIYNNGSGYPRLTDWSTLMVRVSEGYSLTFTSDGTVSGGEIREGDVITSSDGSKSARVVMTPILTSATGKKADWTSKVAAGTLVLANIPTPADTTTTFASGDGLYVNGVKMAVAGTFSSTKKNYIRAYFTDPTARGANNTEIDASGTAVRKNNPRGTVNWPPDPLTDLEADSTKDYVTLVQWDNTNGLTSTSTPTAIMTSTSEPSAIIVSNALTSPTWTSSDTLASFVSDNNSSIAGDSIGLMTSSDSGPSTYYDDFAVQLDLNSGTGFMTPIQQ